MFKYKKRKLKVGSGHISEWHYLQNGFFKIFHHIPATAMTAEARLNPALPATAVVDFMAKWSNLCPGTVLIQREDK